MNTAENLVLVSDEVAVKAENQGIAGLQVHWQLKGDLSIQAVADAIRPVLGDQAIPDAVTDQIALKRALEGLKGAAQVRPFKKGGVEGYSFVMEDQSKTEIDDNGNSEIADAYKVTLSASIREVDGRRLLKVVPKSDMENHIALAFKTAKAVMPSTDVSIWMVRKVISSLEAYSVREKGGIYLIPPKHVAKWREIEKALSSISTFNTQGRLVNGIKTFAMPFVQSHDLASLVVDRAMEEMEEVSAEVFKSLSNTDKKKRIAGFQALERRVNEALLRAQNFAHLIEDSMPAIQCRLDELQTNIGLAMAQRFGEIAVANGDLEQTDDEEVVSVNTSGMIDLSDI